MLLAPAGPHVQEALSPTRLRAHHSIFSISSPHTCCFIDTVWGGWVPNMLPRASYGSSNPTTVQATG